MGCGSLLEQNWELSQFFIRQLRAAAEALVSLRTIASGPALDRLDADSQGPGDGSGRFPPPQSGEGRKTPLL
jgi:hypothetical protein